MIGSHHQPSAHAMDGPTIGGRHMLTYGSHHQSLSQCKGCTIVGWHTLLTGSHHEPVSQSPKPIAGVLIVAIENGMSAAAKMTAA